MRNLSFLANKANIHRIDFLNEFSSEVDASRLRKAFSSGVWLLLRAFETSDVRFMSPSEQQVHDGFVTWFSEWTSCGSYAKGGPQPGPRDCHINRAFVYFNCNTGANVTFIGCIDCGYGDIFGLPEEL